MVLEMIPRALAGVAHQAFRQEARADVWPSQFKMHGHLRMYRCTQWILWWLSPLKAPKALPPSQSTNLPENRSW